MMSVRRYVVHPNYDEATDEYDVGLIFLEESTSFDIAFPRINDDASRPARGSFARVMGWGDTNERDDRKVVSEDLVVADLEVHTLVRQLPPCPSNRQRNPKSNLVQAQLEI